MTTFVSIVMPSFNQASFIEEAIKSVFDQDYSSIELIVMDGGSTDGSVDLFKKLSSIYGPKLRWYSEKDNGPAHAINKAIKLAKGEVLGWLNSDDLYANGSIKRAVDFFLSNPSMLMVYGEGEHVDIKGNSIERYPTLPPSVGIQAFSDGCFICQPTVFLKREVLEEIGFLDEDLLTSFDFEFWLRIFKTYPDRIGFIDQLQANSRLHDKTITNTLRRVVAVEAIKVLAKHLGSPKPHWILTYVNELCEIYPFVDEVTDIKKHLLQTIELVRGDLSSADYTSLIHKIKQDKRFKISPPNVFTNIYPNGWAPQILEIRLSRKKKKFSKIRIDCLDAVSDHLRVRTSWGYQENVKLDSRSRFILDLECPKELKDEKLYIFIESDNVIRANLERKYSFKVKKIILDRSTFFSKFRF